MQADQGGTGAHVPVAGGRTAAVSCAHAQLSTESRPLPAPAPSLSLRAFVCLPGQCSLSPSAGPASQIPGPESSESSSPAPKRMSNEAAFVLVAPRTEAPARRVDLFVGDVRDHGLAAAADESAGGNRWSQSGPVGIDVLGDGGAGLSLMALGLPQKGTFVADLAGRGQPLQG